MKLITNSYTKAINKSLNRSGHLFEGKYKLKLVDSTEYLIHLSRYLHVNPVQARIVKSPEDWEFSSYRDFIGIRKGTLPETKLILDNFASTQGYLEFVNDFKPKNLDLIRKYLYD